MTYVIYNSGANGSNLIGGSDKSDLTSPVAACLERLPGIRLFAQVSYPPTVTLPYHCTKTRNWYCLLERGCPGPAAAEERLKRPIGMSSSATFENHLTDHFCTCILIAAIICVWRPHRCLPHVEHRHLDRQAARPVLSYQHLEYGDSLEPNSNEQSSRWTDGQLASRLRRQRHARDSENHFIARNDSGLLCRLVPYHRL